MGTRNGTQVTGFGSKHLCPLSPDHQPHTLALLKLHMGEWRWKIWGMEVASALLPAQGFLAFRSLPVGTAESTSEASVSLWLASGKEKFITESVDNAG